MTRKQRLVPTVLCPALVAFLLCPGCGTDKAKDKAKPPSAEERTDALVRYQTVKSLRAMAMALYAFQFLGEDQRLPPADGSEMPGEPKLAGLSWRAYLLRYLDSDINKIRAAHLYRNLRDGKYPPVRDAAPSERWNRPDLKTLRLNLFASPVPATAKEPWLTFYRVFVGKGTLFEKGKALQLEDHSVPDGLAQTLLIVEAADPVPWPKPEELEYDPKKPLPKLGGHFPGGFYAAFADTKVRLIPKGTDEKTIRAMITRNGGEKVELLPEVDAEALRKTAGLE